jgi:hypothetical protein
MIDISIEQAIYRADQHGTYRCQCRSPGFSDQADFHAVRLCSGFLGKHNAEMAGDSVFAQPLNRDWVMVAQFHDRRNAQSPAPGLYFRFLMVPRKAYRLWLGDPFTLADHFPPTWHATELPRLSYRPDLSLDRHVADIETVLGRPDADRLLAATQALVDGARIAITWDSNAAEFIRSVWRLLPLSTRSELWPASLALNNSLAFDCIAMPTVDGETKERYLTDDQIDSYPTGRYEENLRSAIETADRHHLIALLQRRSRAQTLRLAVVLVILAAALAVAMRIFTTSPANDQGRPERPNMHFPQRPPQVPTDYPTT